MNKAVLAGFLLMAESNFQYLLKVIQMFDLKHMLAN